MKHAKILDKKPLPPTSLDYTSAMRAAVYYGKQVARHDWVTTWVEYNGDTCMFYDDGVGKPWAPTPEDRNAVDWEVRG